MCSLFSLHIRLFVSGDRTVSEHTVDIHCGSSFIQGTNSIPDVSGDGPVADVLPVPNEDTNGGLTVTESFQETARYGCDVLYHLIKGD